FRSIDGQRFPRLPILNSAFLSPAGHGGKPSLSKRQGARHGMVRENPTFVPLFDRSYAAYFASLATS
ncbi:MAG: hypothetical protein WD065_20175, partial [Planctomycetaceae bacterium]